MKTRSIRKAIAAVCLAALFLLPGCGEKKAAEPETAQSILEKMNDALTKACSAETEIQGSGRLEPGAEFDFFLSERRNCLQGRSSLTGSAGLRVNGIEMDLPLEAVYDQGESRTVLYLKLLDVWTKQEFRGDPAGPESGAYQLRTEKAILQDETEEIRGVSCRVVTIEVTVGDAAAALPAGTLGTGDVSADPGLTFLRTTIWIDRETLLPVREQAELLNSLSSGGSTLAEFQLQREYRSFGTVSQLAIPIEATDALPLMDMIELLRGGERG